MKTQELTHAEMTAINGGDDFSRLVTVIAGNIGYSHTNEDGETESSSLGFNLGSLSDYMND